MLDEIILEEIKCKMEDLNAEIDGTNNRSAGTFGLKDCAKRFEEALEMYPHGGTPDEKDAWSFATGSLFADLRLCINTYEELHPLKEYTDTFQTLIERMNKINKQQGSRA